MTVCTFCLNSEKSSTYHVQGRMCYIKDIKMDKIWCLLSKNSQSSGEKGSEKLSAIQIYVFE